MKNILNMTTQLNDQLDILALEFEKEAVKIGDSEMFQRVKEETVPIYEMLGSWEATTLAFIKERKLKTVHPQQITATLENYEMLLMHSYFRDIRRRKYMETKNSCHYIFLQIIKEISDENTVD